MQIWNIAQGGGIDLFAFITRPNALIQGGHALCDDRTNGPFPLSIAGCSLKNECNYASSQGKVTKCERSKAEG